MRPTPPIRLALTAPALAVLAVAAAAARAQPPAGARVAGTVYDSVARAPLGGAVVQAVSTARPADVPTSATTDSLGRFALGALAPGQWVATFAHPRLDSLGLRAPTYLVTVRDTSPVHVALATPSAARVRAEYCGPAAARDSVGVLVGYLLRTADRGPLEGGTVAARWLEIGFVRGQRGLTQQVAERQTRSATSGWFALCGVPLGSEVTVVASHAADTTGAILVRLPEAGIARRDLYVGAATRVAVEIPAGDSIVTDTAATDATARPVASGPLTAVTRRGAGRVAGTVRSAHGGPIRGARLTVAGSDAAAVTDERGEFVLRDVPEGTQTLSARAVGFFPDDRAVDVFADGTAAVHVALASVRSVLDTIRVVGKRVRPPKVAAFEERRRARVGTFLDSVTIARTNQTATSELFRRAASMAIVPWFDRRTGRVRHLLRVRGGGLCLPVVFIDGFAIHLREDLREMDQFVTPSDIQGLEIYTAGQAPAELTRFGACATVAVTTKW